MHNQVEANKDVRSTNSVCLDRDDPGTQNPREQWLFHRGNDLVEGSAKVSIKGCVSLENKDRGI